MSTTHPLLDELRDFQDKWGVEDYAPMFFVYDEETPLEGWLAEDNEEFSASLLEFARANDTGSVYAFWLGQSSEPFTEDDFIEAPIVGAGDEGGLWVVARNFVELLNQLRDHHYLEINVDEALFVKDEPNEWDDDDEWEPAADPKVVERFGRWVAKRTPAGAPEPSVEAAQAQFQEAFDQWAVALSAPDLHN